MMVNRRVTHEVFNQAPDLAGINLFQADLSLQKAVQGLDGGWGREGLSAYGAMAGGTLAELGRLANRFPPELNTHDRYGNRIETVTYHPAYHQLMDTAISHGVHALPWEAPRPGAHVVRAALELLHYQADSGTDCPLTMTFAAVPALQANPALAEAWLPKLTSRRYDPADIPARAKPGITLGMAMTEKQGGTDVRANTSTAVPTNERTPEGECFELSGHKWFCSAPMSDGFLTLAKLDGALTCFLMPRWRPDGERNAIFIQRLKDKLGNHSNASSEIEFDGAFAWRLGEPGRGVATIIQMVALTRFNCMVGSTAIMRHGLIQALNHVRHRAVSGKRLIEQPLMRNVIADLALETEAALWLTFRVAAALDNRNGDPHEALFVRLATAIGKYWICKRTPQHVNECQECLGGLGYVEEHVLPRLYREAPLNSIWEGCGNVQCLDILRAMNRAPETADVLFAELQKPRGENARFDRHVDDLSAALKQSHFDPFGARILAERMALLLQGSLLLRYAKGAVADAFIDNRLQPTTLAYGGLRDAGAVADLLAGVSLD